MLIRLQESMALVFKRFGASLDHENFGLVPQSPESLNLSQSPEAPQTLSAEPPCTPFTLHSGTF